MRPSVQVVRDDTDGSRALDLTGVGESFEFFDDVQSAVRSFL